MKYEKRDGKVVQVYEVEVDIKEVVEKLKGEKSSIQEQLEDKYEKIAVIQKDIDFLLGLEAEKTTAINEIESEFKEEVREVKDVKALSIE